MKTYPNKAQYLYYAALSMIQKVPSDKLATDPSIIMAERTIDKAVSQFSFSTVEGKLEILTILFSFFRKSQKGF
jgi:hypothetical protein